MRFTAGPAGLVDRSTMSDWRAVVEEVEQAGFDGLCLGDHFDGRQDPIALLAAIGQWGTGRLELSTHVLANELRTPAQMCRHVATLTMVTGERFRCGVGAGWREADHAAAGAPFPNASHRIDRLAEAVAILKRSWTDEIVDHDGTHYTVRGMIGRSLLGGATPPTLVMGGGGPRMLALAAREADVVSINVALRRTAPLPVSSAEVSLQAFADKVEQIGAVAAERAAHPSLQVVVHHVIVTERRNDALDRLAQQMEVSPADLARSPHVLVGSESSIAAQLAELGEIHGIAEVAVSVAAVRDLAPVLGALKGKQGKQR
jgi:probable F420-dependent oxidoreductase